MFISVSALTNRPNPLPPESDTILPEVIASTSVLLTLALITYILRIWLRISRSGQNLGWDDAAITIALLLSIVCYGLEVYITVITKGHHVWYIAMPVFESVGKMSFVLINLWVWVVTMIKISICLMLLRIKGQSKPWRYGLGALIAFMSAMAIASTVCYIMMCNPIEANWQLKYAMDPKACWSLKRYVDLTYAIASIIAATDLITALLPIAFVCKLHRPLREKVVLCTLMGLGLMASVCGIMKMVLLEPTLSSSDPIFEGVSAQIWAFGECYIGIFAANIPCLKALLDAMFRKAGEAITGNMSIGKHSHGHASHGRDYELSDGLNYTKGQEFGYRSTVESVNGPKQWPSHVHSRAEDNPDRHHKRESRWSFDVSRNCYVTTEYEVLYSDPARSRVR